MCGQIHLSSSFACGQSGLVGGVLRAVALKEERLAGRDFHQRTV